MKGTNSQAPRVPQAFVDMIGDHFLEAARYLREIQDEHPDDFVSVAKNLGIGRRKAYQLAQVKRSFHELDITENGKASRREREGQDMWIVGGDVCRKKKNMKT